MTPREALKNKKVRIYLRVSGAQQEGTLPDQEKTVKGVLKALGFKGRPEVYSEQASGTKKDRAELMRMLQDIRDSPKDSVVVVRDFQRFTRDPVHYGALWDEFRDRGIRILSTNENMVTGTASLPDPSSDLIVPILISAGGSEVNVRKLQTIQGVQRAKEKGILQGSAPLFYRKDALEPRTEMLRLMKAGVSGRGIAQRLGKSTSFVRKNKKKFEEILVAGGDDLLNDYLETINLVRDFMNEKDADVRGSKASVRMKTVVRMVSGYLNNPNGGLTKPTREELEEYYDNFNIYKAKPKR
jgi:DNA invertase Pin-like site-specific DNA recombinase